MVAGEVLHRRRGDHYSIHETINTPKGTYHEHKIGAIRRVLFENVHVGKSGLDAAYNSFVEFSSSVFRKALHVLVATLRYIVSVRTSKMAWIKYSEDASTRTQKAPGRRA